MNEPSRRGFSAGACFDFSTERDLGVPFKILMIDEILCGDEEHQFRVVDAIAGEVP